MSDEKKIVLNMSEDNEISFGLSIEGYSSDPSHTSSPKIRFALTEENNNGFILPADFAEGQVSIKIPASKMFKEGKEYKGVLEVFLGNRYFKPAEIGIEFKKPLEVKANLVSEGISDVSKTTEIQAKRKPIQRYEEVPTKPRRPQRESVETPVEQPIRSANVKPAQKKLSVLEEINKLLEEEERLKRLLIEKRKANTKANAKVRTKEEALKQHFKKLFIES